MFPNTFKQLANLMINGATIEAECRSKCEDLESYVDGGMRLTVIGITEDHDDVIKLQVSYEKYEEHNKAFEKRNYYDKNGVPCLNAREAGYYTVKDTLYVMATDDPNDYFISLSDSANKWIVSYLRNRHKDETYVAFLERMLDNTVDALNETRTYYSG